MYCAELFCTGAGSGATWRADGVSAGLAGSQAAWRGCLAGCKACSPSFQSRRQHARLGHRSGITSPFTSHIWPHWSHCHAGTFTIAIHPPVLCTQLVHSTTRQVHSTNVSSAHSAVHRTNTPVCAAASGSERFTRLTARSPRSMPAARCRARSPRRGWGEEYGIRLLTPQFFLSLVLFLPPYIFVVDIRFRLWSYRDQTEGFWHGDDVERWDRVLRGVPLAF